MGGKVALEYTKQSMLPPSKTVVLDSFPSVIPPEFESGTKGSFESISAPKMMEILSEIPLPISNRGWLKNYLLEKGFPTPLAIWMTTNLRPYSDENGFVWKFNLESIPSVS